MIGSEKLGRFLGEVSNWYWDDFVRAEQDKSYTSNQAIIFALVRACAMQNLSAIKLALNRLDGKLKTPVKIEYPKIFYLYPKAKLVDPGSKADALSSGIPSTTALEVISGDVVPVKVPVEAQESDLPSMSLRQTLSKMSDFPRELPEAIIQLAEQTHQWVQKHAEKPLEIPRVKSVVAAHLLVMAANRNIDALTEVFDQIDGKLVETLQILGDDIYIINYSLEAPPGAYLNADGVLQLEAETSQQMWATKLGDK